MTKIRKRKISTVLPLAIQFDVETNVDITDQEIAENFAQLIKNIYSYDNEGATCIAMKVVGEFELDKGYAD